MNAQRIVVGIERIRKKFLQKAVVFIQPSFQQKSRYMLNSENIVN